MRPSFTSRPGMARGVRTAAALLGCVIFLAGCGKKADESSVAAAPPGGAPAPAGTAAERVDSAAKSLQAQFEKPSSSFHFSYAASVKGKSEAVEADVSPEAMNVTTTSGDRKETAEGHSEAGEGWTNLAAAPLKAAMLNPMVALAFARSTIREAGVETLPGGSALRYEFNTATVTGADREGLDAAQKMTGCTRVQGTAWVDKLGGRLAKFNIDAELKDKSGAPRKEHYEAVVTPKQ